jgi:hypothetical protein
MSNELLKSLNKSVSTKKETKQDRPTVDVPAEALESFVRYAGASTITEVAQARKDVEADILNTAMMNQWTIALFNSGTRPANPRLQTEKEGKPDIQGLFQVQARYKYNIVPGDDDLSKRIVESLTTAGVPKPNAQRIVKEEVDASPQTYLRPFNELVNGHYEGKVFVEATDTEKEIATKLLKFVMELTEEERNAVIRQQENVKVKDGFLERLKGYVKTVEQAQAVLKVIQPVYFTSHIKFGVSDTPDEVVTRLTEECGRIIGSSIE